MKNNLIVCLIFLLACTTLYSQELLYLASGGAIESKKIDPKTGKLTDFQKVELPSLSKFTFSRNGKFLYAQASIQEGNKKSTSVATYSIATDGKLTFLYNAAISGGTTELKTDHTDRYLAAANYSNGMVSVWKLEDGIYKGKLAQEIMLEKKAHAARFSPDNKVLLIPATGPNKVFELAFDEKTGKVTKKSEALGPNEGAAQPRHLIFHPTLNIAYSTQERQLPGVGVWSWSPKKGELAYLNGIVDGNEADLATTNADLHLSPDQKFLYVSCRDKKDKFNQIIAYKVNPKDGALTFVKKFPCESVPRSFGLNKTGDFLYVCGQMSSKLGVYKINKTTGHLSKVTQYETGKGPIWVETLTR